MTDHEKSKEIRKRIIFIFSILIILILGLKQSYVVLAQETNTGVTAAENIPVVDSDCVSMMTSINNQRISAGEKALIWDENMSQDASIRASECSVLNSTNI